MSLKIPHSGHLILTRAIALTPSDSTAIASSIIQKGFSVNIDGNVAIVTKNFESGVEDPAVTIAVKAGILYPLSLHRINSTNTTATGITIYA